VTATSFRDEFGRRNEMYDAPETGAVEPEAAGDELEGIEDLDELEFLLEEIESKIAPLALTSQA